MQGILGYALLVACLTCGTTPFGVGAPLAGRRPLRAGSPVERLTSAGGAERQTSAGEAESYRGNPSYRDNWPQWRGPQADGVAPRAQPPLHWDAETNIRWRVAIPGQGSATPIVWQDQVFVLAAVPTTRQAEEPPLPAPDAKTRPPGNYYEFVVTAVDRSSGKIRWTKVVCEAVPHEGQHPTNTYASASPATDGKRLIASFGSRGVYCLDLQGNLLWKRNLGQMRTRYGWGEGTSPVISGDSVVINWDHEDPSFLIVLDAETGETRWKVERDEPSSWATPLVVEHAGRRQLVVNGTKRARGYDLETGELLWQCGGQTVNAIPSPVRWNDLVICMSGYRGAAAVAIPLTARGDITQVAGEQRDPQDDSVVWHHTSATPYVPSPLLTEGRLYFTAGNGNLLSCLDAATGRAVFEPRRLPGLASLYASPIAAAGRIYLVYRDGTALVLKSGTSFEVLATNRLDDRMDASPVAVDRQLFLRGAEHLYCIEEPATEEPNGASPD